MNRTEWAGILVALLGGGAIELGLTEETGMDMRKGTQQEQRFSIHKGLWHLRQMCRSETDLRQSCCRQSRTCVFYSL